ncbi:putative glycolipid-binding domain-containing protein [Actinoplanes sp. NPDC051861]|uniref:putative glycolipid-binding domain-containing protein n=1 Tax=Actinoplanes sp. NPDC051861 TaxID=3155170 RepID=UPI0034208CDB
MTDTMTARTLLSGPLAWQRTDVVGTELVLAPGGGTAVVHGALPYAMTWTAEVDDDAVVRELSVTCRGGGWSRTLDLRRNAGGWTCHAAESGDAGLPAPGCADPAAIPEDAVLRVTDSPVFVSWAVRRLALTAESGPVTVPSARVLVPSLAVVPSATTYHLVSPKRLRVTGDGPATTYELDPSGVVAYQPGRLRLVR